MSVDQNVEAVFYLFDAYGNEPYMDYGISQKSHMIQSAMFAEKDNQPPEVVLGALLHDIGNLVGHDRDGVEKVVVSNVDMGPKDHDALGEAYLKAMNFPIEIYCFARGHVDALRYLAYKNANYKNDFNWRSMKTLERKGGPMAAQEATAFETLPNFHAVIKCRHWDEQSTSPNENLEPLEKYKRMAYNYLNNRKTI